MKYGLLLAALLLMPSSARAAQIKVCASGCPYTNAQLQNALDAAHDGDEVLLQSGFTYHAAPLDGYVMGPGCKAPTWECITIRTGVTSTGTVMARSDFPPDGVRVDPTLLQCLNLTASCRGVYATMLPTNNTEGALRTVYPGQNWGAGFGGCDTIPCVGSGWTVKWIEFGPRIEWPEYALVRFGTNQVGRQGWTGVCTWPDITPSCWTYPAVLPNGDSQDRLVEVPRYLSIIQCDLHGDPVVGNFNGLLLASRETRVIGNSFRDFKSTREGQAITGVNGIGPHLIENNHIEATGENVVWGGQDTYLFLMASVGSSPTTTSITLTSPIWYNWSDGSTVSANLATDMFSGQFFSLIHGGHEYSGMTCTLAGSTCTISPALPFTPTVGDQVRWQWIHGGLTFRYNHFYKPPEWRLPAIPTPTNVVATGSNSGGSLNGTYCYRVYAYLQTRGEWLSSDTSAQQCATVSGSGSVTVTWTAVAGAFGYFVLGRASGAPTVSWEPVTTTITDTGSNSTGTQGVSTPNYWIVKNNFELKNCEGAGPMGPCLIEYNVIDYSWCCTQDNIVTIKTHNQDGWDSSGVVRNLTMQNNWVRHGGSAITPIATDAASGNPSGVMTDVVFANNLFTDLKNTWAWPYESGSFMAAIQMTAGENAYRVGPNECVRCTWRHNTFLVDSDNMRGPMRMTFPSSSSADKMVDYVVKDNIMGRNSSDATQVAEGYSGLHAFNPGLVTNGTPSWTATTTGASVADHNAWPGGNSTMYSFDANGFYPSQATLQTYLANYATCQVGSDITACALTGATPLDGTASDATDVGANIAAIKVGTDFALSGDLTTFAPPETPATTGGPRLRLRMRGGGAQ